MSDKLSLSSRLFAWAGGYVGCAAILSTILGGAAGFGLGIVYSEARGYFRQYQAERELIDPILASDSAFRDLKCSRRSSGGISLGGFVPTKADRDRLREQIVRAVGEKRAEEIMYGVQFRRV